MNSTLAPRPWRNGGKSALALSSGTESGHSCPQDLPFSPPLRRSFKGTSRGFATRGLAERSVVPWRQTPKVQWGPFIHSSNPRHHRTVLGARDSTAYKSAGEDHSPSPASPMTPPPSFTRRDVLKTSGLALLASGGLTAAAPTRPQRVVVAGGWTDLSTLYFAPYIAKFTDEFQPFGVGLDHLDEVLLGDLLAQDGASEAAMRFIGGRRSTPGKPATREDLSALFRIWQAAI